MHWRGGRHGAEAGTGTEKQVNTQWAIDLIAAVPPKKVHARVVSCLFLPL